MAQKTYYAVGIGGILGTFGADPEVVGVFPSVSSSVQVRSQRIQIVRGDSCDLGIQIQDDQDPPDMVAISHSVLRFAVKVGYGDVSDASNAQACIVKTSAEPEEIEVTNGTNGQAIIHLRKEDTQQLPLGELSLFWDLEMSLPSAQLDLPESASAQLTTGSPVIFSPQNIWTSLGLYAGFIVHIQGRRVRVVEVLNSAQLLVDFSGWVSETIPSTAPGCEPDFAVYSALSKTVARGPFNVDGDVII